MFENDPNPYKTQLQAQHLQLIPIRLIGIWKCSHIANLIMLSEKKKKTIKTNETFLFSNSVHVFMMTQGGRFWLSSETPSDSLEWVWL